MKVALVLARLDPSGPSRVLRRWRGDLEAAGHRVDLVLLCEEDSAPLPFAGYPRSPADTILFPQAASGERYDAAVAATWDGFYATFALDAAARVRLVLGDERPLRTAGQDAGLIERTYRDRAAGVVTVAEWKRAWLASEMGRDDAALAPIAIDRSEFHPERAGRPAGAAVRVLIEGAGLDQGEHLDLAFRAAGRVPGLEVWHVATDGFARPEWAAARRIGPVPLDAMAPIYRSCDVLLRLSAHEGASLTPLEMMACGGTAVVAREPGREEYLRHQENALLVLPGDVDGAVRALGRLVDDAALRCGLAAGAAATVADQERASREAPVERALIEAAARAEPALPSKRRELAAIGDLLRRERLATAAVARATEPWPRALAAVGRAGLRRAKRALRPVGSPGRAGVATPGPRTTKPAAADSRGLRPGEPILFAGDPEYFRSAWFDAVAAGWGVELPCGGRERAALADLPVVAARTGARTCVVFEPWCTTREALAALRARDVRLVAYSTEPVPHDGCAAPHWDQLRRLDNLRRARDLGWDLVVHFDPSSLGTLRAEGFGQLAAHPLPVSEALFYPEEIERDLDVCFLGWSTPHREAFLAPLKDRYRTVHVASGLVDEDARRLMNRAKLVVNLHCHEYSSFENRCIQTLFCGRPLASEPLSGDWLSPGVDYLLARTPEELLAHATRVIEGGGAPAAPGDAAWRPRFLAASLRDFLESAALPAAAGGRA